MQIFSKTDSEVIYKIISQLGYSDKSTSIKVDNNFHNGDIETGRLRFYYTDKVDRIRGVPINNIIDKETPLEKKQHLFILVEEEKNGNVSFTFFTSFADNDYFIFNRYLDENKYSNLGVYFIERTIIDDDTDFEIIPVSFSAYFKGISIDNFGEIKNNKITNRAIRFVNTEKAVSDMKFSEIGLDENSLIQEWSLNNILELGLYKDNIQKLYVLPMCRYFTSIKELSDAAAFIVETSNSDYNVALTVFNSVKKGTLNYEKQTVVWEEGILGTAEEAFEYSKTYWQSVYEEGLKE